MGIFVAVSIVLVVLIYFMIVMLRSVTSRANQKVDEYFLGNLQQYDDVTSEKMSSMNKMYGEHKALQREIKSMQNELVSYKTSPFYAPRPLARDIYIPTARYIDNDFFEEYKVAKDKLLSINKQQVINELLGKVNYTGNIERYQVTRRIMEELNFDAMYDLCSLPGQDQYQVLSESFDEDEQTIFTEYTSQLEQPEDFDVLAFLNYVKLEQRQHDPYVYVYVGENEVDYSNEDRMIVCRVDDNICEGLKIVYQNQIYDYSIYKSRRKVGS